MENNLTADNQQDWIKKSIEIKASDDKVWNTLTHPGHVEQWAGAFQEGTIVETDWGENSIITWKQKDGQNGVKGRIEVIYPGKMLKINYFDDINSPDDAETGAFKEHYLLTEHQGCTTFTIETGPLDKEHIDKMKDQWDEALKIIKEVSEAQ
ncbi:SRPBCC domain-containing protein [Pedobacter sp. JY14-1]|uniref:SRPBCC family protein n=1 Tax=Pedobacter sp. JY14-1 TaxID=3034151 RepID=UPI0023E17F84|nr:SRPBCC domain-containing protein [Pedobacter sp. JY14-1]